MIVTARHPYAAFGEDLRRSRQRIDDGGRAILRHLSGVACCVGG
jgi:hypothetical protein